MRRANVIGILLLTATAASGQEYLVGGYYAPYGECVEVRTETRTLYSAPSLYRSPPPVTAAYAAYPEPDHSLAWYSPNRRYGYDRPRWNRWRWRRWHRHYHDHHHHHHHDCRCD